LGDDLKRLASGATVPQGTKAVILAGGRGTRLAPLTSILPKPLMPIGERSILEIILDQLIENGFLDITLSVGYLSHLIRAVVENGGLHHEPGRPTPRISYVHEQSPLGTAAPLRLVEGLDSSFLVMNGDVLTTLDYAELFQAHLAAGNVLTIAAKKRTIATDYGVLHLDTSQRVTGYDEKPEVTSMVSMGIYVLEPRALEYIPDDAPFDFPDFVAALLEAGEPIGAYPYAGLWLDIGRKEDFELAVSTWTNDHPTLEAAPSDIS
jgi:NDP-mannose synthase